MAGSENRVNLNEKGFLKSVGNLAILPISKEALISSNLVLLASPYSTSSIPYSWQLGNSKGVFFLLNWVAGGTGGLSG
jgi:hypothetical protein